MHELRVRDQRASTPQNKIATLAWPSRVQKQNADMNRTEQGVSHAVRLMQGDGCELHPIRHVTQSIDATLYHERVI